MFQCDPTLGQFSGTINFAALSASATTKVVEVMVEKFGKLLNYYFLSGIWGSMLPQNPLE